MNMIVLAFYNPETEPHTLTLTMLPSTRVNIISECSSMSIRDEAAIEKSGDH